MYEIIGNKVKHIIIKINADSNVVAKEHIGIIEKANLKEQLQLSYPFRHVAKF